MPAIRGARPIRNSEVLEFHDNILQPLLPVSIEHYASVWNEWMNYGSLNSIEGLHHFGFADYTQGTSQTFDQFILRHSNDREIIVLKGDFQYHACLGKHVEFKYVDSPHHLEGILKGPGLHALLISAPFSDFGCMHPEFEQLMKICNVMDIPVCLDLAYWGISKNCHLNLNDYPAIKEVTCSLSKPFFTLENHRVGIRWTKEYADDGVSMLNEVEMQNKHSMSLGVEYMRHFGPDYNWNKYAQEYGDVCDDQDLVWSDTVIFALGDDVRHSEFNRGVHGNYRVCISEWLGDA